MASNKDFRKEISQGLKAQFHLCDLHVHSPASSDFGQAKETRLSPTEHEAQISKYDYPVDKYFEELVEHLANTDHPQAMSKGHQWGIVGITDHNVFRYAAELSEYAWDNLKDNQLIVLPGVELEVIFSLPSIDEKIAVHLLLLFPPKTSSGSIEAAIQIACNRVWTYGSPLEIDNLTSFVRTLRSKECGAMVVAAHVASSKGVQASSKNILFEKWTKENSELARILGEIDADQSEEDQEKKLPNEELSQLEQKRNDLQAAIANEAQLEVLKLIGKCGFDALQVTSLEAGKHYSRLHRFKENVGRAVPIICSDAHSVADVFNRDGMLPFIKLHTLSHKMRPEDLFHDIRDRGLRFGETRFRTHLPPAPSLWISGIEILRDDTENSASFWTRGKAQWLSLSPNLNCLVGGRGSGKSALIEALDFVQDTSGHNSQSNKKKDDQADWFKRASATLRGCNVKVCWQYSTAPDGLKRGSVFQEAFFPQDSRRLDASRMSDLDGEPLEKNNYPECKAAVFRIKDIEDAAAPKELATLFDKLCGDSLTKIQAKIDSKLEELVTQREVMAVIANQLSAVTAPETPLMFYVDRHSRYSNENTPEIGKIFDKYDKIEDAKNNITNLKQSWETAASDFQAQVWEDELTAFETAINEKISSKECSLECCQTLAATLLGKGEGHKPGLVSNLMTKLGEVSGLLSAINDAILEAEKGAQAEIDNAKKELDENGVPEGSRGRQAKKQALQEAENSLGQYRQLIVKWDEQYRQRLELRKELLRLQDERSRIRSQYAEDLTGKLRKDLDDTVLQLEITANPSVDKTEFRKWLTNNLTCKLPRSHDARSEALIKQSSPDQYKQCLLGYLENESDHIETFVVEAPTQQQGKLSLDEAKTIHDECAGRTRYHFEIEEKNKAALPKEIVEGIWMFPMDQKGISFAQSSLELDEILFEDRPVIRLNDRPYDSESKLRLIDELSPGQRCSAVLPILLLSGREPLIIDQPEDNLDNRLIRQVVVNILNSMKLRRQVVLATHNPNLPVLGDAEQTIVLQAINDKDGEIVAKGDLDTPEIVNHITDVMEGGREAFQYRQTIYQTHWRGDVHN